MPDVMVMENGKRVTSQKQWKKRREEMKRILEYYAVGTMPPPPGNVKGKKIRSETVLDGKVRYRLVHLSFGPEEKLGLDIGIFTPAAGGPFPTIILQSIAIPGASPLPRLPQGPNQGRGQDVLLLVGPAPVPATSASIPAAAAQSSFASGPITAQSMAEQNAEVFRRGYAVGSIYLNVDPLRIFPQVEIGVAALTRPTSDGASLKFRNLEH
jgi:hypothetical protein